MKFDQFRNWINEILVFPIVGVAKGRPRSKKSADVHTDVSIDQLCVFFAEWFEWPAESIVGIVVIMPCEIEVRLSDGLDIAETGNEERNITPSAGDVAQTP